MICSSSQCVAISNSASLKTRSKGIGIIHQHIPVLLPMKILIPQICFYGHWFSIPALHCHCLYPCKMNNWQADRLRRLHIFFQQFMRQRIRKCIGHFHKTGNASCNGSPGLCLYGSLMGKPGFTEMHLVVNTSGERNFPSRLFRYRQN